MPSRFAISSISGGPTFLPASIMKYSDCVLDGAALNSRYKSSNRPLFSILSIRPILLRWRLTCVSLSTGRLLQRVAEDKLRRALIKMRRSGHSRSPENYASPLPRSQRLCAPDKKRFDTAKTQSGHRLSAQQPRLGESIRLVAADTWSKRLIVELAKSSGLLVEKKRKECISASPCDAGNRVHQRARKYDGAADRRLEASRPVFRKA